MGGKGRSDRSSVSRYKHKQEIDDCLASGWAVTTIVKYLIKTYGEAPSERAIQRYREKNPVIAQVLPHSFITGVLKGVKYKVDVIAHLSRLIPLLEDRIARSLSKEVSDFAGLPLSASDQAVRSYLEAVKEYVSVAQDLGILDKAVQQPLIDARTQSLTISPETLQAVSETVKDINESGVLTKMLNMENDN